MKVIATDLPGVRIIEPEVFGDHRGFFFESWSRQRYEAAGLPGDFVQDNLSRSSKGVLRGLHLQHPGGQGKLVSVVEGEVFDVAVDVRVGSPTFGRWIGESLSADNHLQLYIPPGFAHGFAVVSETALFTYKCTEYYSPGTELGVRFDDPEIGINWPVVAPTVSSKDGAYPPLSSVDPERLPRYEDEPHKDPR